MSSKQIIIISGAPGSGKSSVSKRLAETSEFDHSVHMHTDDFYGYIRKGYISPWLLEAKEQNTVIIEAFAASVARLASGGYEVIVDGVIGPWFMEPWTALVRHGFTVKYIILRPDERTTISRATGRNERTALTDADVIRQIHCAFLGLGEFEKHVIDTTNLDIDETVKAIRKKTDAFLTVT